MNPFAHSKRGTSFKKLYSHTPNQCEICIQCKELFIFSNWRTLKGIQCRTLSVLLTTPCPSALFFLIFPEIRISTSHLPDCTDLTGSWIWSLRSWPSGQTLLFKLLFICFFFALPPGISLSKVLWSQPLRTAPFLTCPCSGAWHPHGLAVFCFYSIKSRVGRHFPGEKVLKVGAKTECSEQGKMAGNPLGPLRDWVLNDCCGVWLLAPQGQGQWPFLFGLLTHLLVWCTAYSRCSVVSVEWINEGAIPRSH